MDDGPEPCLHPCLLLTCFHLLPISETLPVRAPQPESEGKVPPQPHPNPCDFPHPEEICPPPQELALGLGLEGGDEGAIIRPPPVSAMVGLAEQSFSPVK